jgi:cytochrome c oxidase cbb3-type subunit I/II
MQPFYALRAFGGTLYLIGALIMMYNLALTAKKSAGVVDDEAEAPALTSAYEKHTSEHWHRKIERKPVPLSDEEAAPAPAVAVAEGVKDSSVVKH